jgi:transposase, IS6 family
VEELLAERAVTVDHVITYRWVQRFSREFIEAARPCHHAPGDRWYVDETYVKVAGKWACLHRASTSMARSSTSCCPGGVTLRPPRFLARALRAGTVPAEITTDRAPACSRVPGELVPSALHTVKQYTNNPIEQITGG